MCSHQNGSDWGGWNQRGTENGWSQTCQCFHLLVDEISASQENKKMIIKQEKKEKIKSIIMETFVAMVEVRSCEVNPDIEKHAFSEMGPVMSAS